jgi:hypothetical protein
VRIQPAFDLGRCATLYAHGGSLVDRQRRTRSHNENPAVHMSDTPLPIASGAQGSAVLATSTQSLWQTASIGLRTIIDCDWMLRRSGAVAVVTGTTR